MAFFVVSHGKTSSGPEKTNSCRKLYRGENAFWRSIPAMTAAKHPGRAGLKVPGIFGLGRCEPRRFRKRKNPRTRCGRGIGERKRNFGQRRIVRTYSLKLRPAGAECRFCFYGRPYIGGDQAFKMVWAGRFGAVPFEAKAHTAAVSTLA